MSHEILREALLNHGLKLGEGFDKAGKPYSWMVDSREVLLRRPGKGAVTSMAWSRNGKLLAFASERKRYPAGTVITRPGDVPVGAQVLVAGAVSVTPDGGEHPRVVSQAGAVLDLMSLMLERV